MRPLDCLPALVALAACSSEPAAVQLADPPATAPARAVALGVGADGVPRLSWIEGQGPHALRASVWSPAGWEAARTLGAGEDWFVNWADVPALAALKDGTLAASWLERSGPATYDYRVRMSVDGAEPFCLHDDGGTGEHGFVSLAALDAERWLAVWLDGRASGGEHDGSGAMQLRARTVSKRGELGTEVLLDARVCDCCATAAVRTSSGDVLVVYRDRESDEVRDLAAVLVSPSDGASTPVRVCDDGWKIAGCPVNGPALAASGAELAVAWFTLGAESRARVQVAFSRDGGRTFGAPTQISQAETDGLVDCAYDASGRLWVSWLERPTRDRGEWRLAPVEDGVVGEARTLAATVPGRAAGIARLVAAGDGLLFAWLDSSDGARLRAQWISTAR
ncbi:MAG: hypothetical protein FJ298_07245 [Planctomycetes bacterium]|nr:hypothetical protein [Planctomycetota bacterium]